MASLPRKTNPDARHSEWPQCESCTAALYGAAKVRLGPEAPVGLIFPKVWKVPQPGYSPHRDCSGLHQRPLFFLLRCEMDFSSHAETEMPQAQTVDSRWGRIGLRAAVCCGLCQWLLCGTKRLSAY